MLLTGLLIPALVQQAETVFPAKPILGVKALAFAPAPKGNAFVATIEDGSVRIYSAATRMPVRNMGAKHPQQPYAVAWSPNGKFIASGDESARIFIFDAASGKKLGEVRRHQRGIQSLSFNSASNILVSTGKDDTIQLYQVPSLKQLKVILGKGISVYSAKFSGGNLVMGSLLSDVQIRKMDGSVVAALKSTGGLGVMDVATNKAGTRLLSAGRDGVATVWDMKSRAKLASLRGHMDWVMYAACSPGGTLYATAGSDRSIRIWNAKNYQRISTIEDASAVGSPLCFTSDGKFLVGLNAQDFITVFSLGSAR